MLRSLKTLKRFDVLLSNDTELGMAHDFFFDERDWTIKYLIADTGMRFAGRTVLVSADAFCAPEWGREKFIVSLSREQVETSPDIDVYKPIMPVEWERLHTHYGWTATHFGDKSFVRCEKGGHVLQEIMKLVGYHVQGNDGIAGTVDDFIVDDENWKIRYIVVGVKHGLMAKTTLVSPDWVGRINYDEGNVNLDMTADSGPSEPTGSPRETTSRSGGAGAWPRSPCRPRTCTKS